MGTDWIKDGKNSGRRRSGKVISLDFFLHLVCFSLLLLCVCVSVWNCHIHVYMRENILKKNFMSLHISVFIIQIFQFIAHEINSMVHDLCLYWFRHCFFFSACCGVYIQSILLHSCCFWQNIAEIFKIAFGIILGNWNVILGLWFDEVMLVGFAE